VEKALRVSEERFKDLFNNALLGLYRTTHDGRILMANPALVRMLGYDSFEELAKRNLEEEGFEPKYFRSEFKERIETEGTVIGLEADWMRRDGTILSIRESAKAIRDEHGNILYYEGTVEDINERKLAEEELRRHRDHLEEMVATRTRELEKNNEVLRMAELRFRSLIEQTTDAVFCYEYDPPIPTDLPLEQQVRLLYDGVLVECNDVCAKSYGAERAEDVIGKRLTELFGTSSGSLDELFTAMIEGGYRTVDAEGVKKFEDGRERYYLNNGHGVIEDGKLVRVWGTFRDITERKQAQDALCETTSLLESIFEHTHMLVAYLDPQFNFVRVNRAYAEADQHQPTFFPGRNHFDLYPDAGNQEIFRQVVETGQPYFTYAKPFEYAEHPERGIGYWDWSLVPIKNQQGNVSGLVLTLADVTARILAEEALKASEGKLNAMLLSISDHMSMMDKDLNILWANDVAKRRFGDDIVGKKCYEVYHGRQSPCETHSCLTLRAFQDGGVHEHDTEDTDKDGNTAWFHCVANVALRNEEGEATAVLEISTDITKRKQAEETLQESEERFRSLSESSPMGVFHTDKEGRVHYTNKRWQEMTGLTLEESLGFGWSNALHPDDKKTLLEEWNRCLSEQKGYSGEFRLVSKSGEVKWVYTKTAPIRSETGQVIGHVGSNQDITERKQAEDTLRQYEFMVESAHDAIFFKDRQSRYIIANDKTLESFGLSREQVIGKSDYEIMPDREQAKQNIDDDQAVLETGKPKEIIKEMTGADGEKRCFQAIKVPQFDENGDVIGLIGIARDITERRHTEEALRESEEKFRSLAEQSPNMIFINKKGRIVYANKKCEEVMGYKREELCSHDFDFRTLIGPESIELVNENFARHLRGQEVGPYDYCLINKKGQRIEAINASKLIQYEAETAILGVVTDITERKQTERELLEHQAKLKSLASQLSLTEERERYRLAMDLHDQISQSLVISKIKLDQLRKSSTSDEFNRSLEDISNSLGRTIDDTRALTFDLSYPILYELGFEAAVAEWLDDQIQEKHGIRTEFEDDEREKPLDDDIRVLLFRNVRELLINVVKHAQAHKVKVSIRIVHKHIIVSVEDDGIGFDPVEVGSMAAKRAEFGLFSIRERLEQLGGLIEIDSEIGRGCRITMTAPLKLNDLTNRA
jgi:PAS domain S-box-containing protein